MVKIFQSLPSTNDYIKEHLSKIEPMTYIIAKEQTEGRGRLERSWESKRDKGLYFSVLLKPEIDIKDFSILAIMAGGSLLKLFNNHGLKPMIKWPNDVLIEERKTSGILCELIYKEEIPMMIVGIGINIAHRKEDFNGTYNLPPTSLYIESNIIYEPIEIFEELKPIFEEEYKFFLNRGLDIEFLNQHLYKDIKRAKIRGEEKEIIIKKITSEGRLLVSSEEGDFELIGGEL